MNNDIYNPVEYWTPKNIPIGVFTCDEIETDAHSVWNFLQNYDWHNATEDFHTIVHFGITQECRYHCSGHDFQFFLQ